MEIPTEVTNPKMADGSFDEARWCGVRLFVKPRS
jgi:hypothetical protein